MAAGLYENVHAVHDCELCACAADVLIRVFLDDIAVGLFVLDCIVGDLSFFDGTERSFERPADQVAACGG